jgi:hypothetical protein
MPRTADGRRYDSRVEQPDAPVTEADRTDLIAGLRTAVGDDRLTLEEFADRAGLVFAATTRLEASQALEGTTAPLPARWSPTPVVATTSVPRVGGRAQRTSQVISILGSAVRKGRWRADNNVRVVSVLGSSTLDFRQATYDPTCDVIEVRVFTVLGSLTVIVPEGVDASLDGIAILGSKVVKLTDAPVVPNTPRIDVRVVCLLGSATLKTKGSGMTARVVKALNQPR